MGRSGESKNCRRNFKIVKSILVRIFGYQAMFLHGDPLVLDRWLWLKKRLPKISPGEKKAIEIGCGNGAFTIGAARRGYQALGIDSNEKTICTAKLRAGLCGARLANFDVLDIRSLDQQNDLSSQFDIAICFETIEHILNDGKLMFDIAGCLKEGGKLLLTTPNVDFNPITPSDSGPFSTIENGWHVRKGYQREDLIKLCQQSNLTVEKISFCSGFLSQKIAWIQRILSMKIHPIISWIVILPIRIFPPIFDSSIRKFTGWPDYSICLEARK